MKYFTLLIMALTSLAMPGWFRKLRSRLPHWNAMNNSQKVALVSFISLTLLLPIITLATLTETRLGSRAVEPATLPVTPPDWQTKEYYDLYIKSDITTITRSGPGHVYGAQTIFQIGGDLQDRINKVTQLFGYPQSTPPEYGSKEISFRFQGEGSAPRFISLPVDLYDNNCVDLHFENQPSANNYIATFCYNLSVVQPNQRQTISSYLSVSVPFIEADYRGPKPAVVMFITSPFNKYETNTPPYNGANRNGHRVHYLTIDRTVSNEGYFFNLRYVLQGLTAGLSNEDYANLCTFGAPYPQKYLKRTLTPNPVDGNNYAVTAGLGACSFEYRTPHVLIADFMSIYYPKVTPPVTPTPSPTATPTPARSIQVKLPNGGETLYVGQTYRISWDSSSNIDKVWLGYTTGPGSLNWIATNIPNTGFYDWKVFVGNTTNTKFKIDITGYQTGYGSVTDQSDNYFTVLPVPPTPTSTPTPTLTPTLTPTPTPMPTPNVAPRIQTWFLPPGRINRNYRANIIGIDRNQNDNLTLTTAGLPTGIIQGPCSTNIQDKNVRISCILSGRPTVTGIYPVHVVLTDNHGGKTENDIFIIIYNFFGLF